MAASQFSPDSYCTSATNVDTGWLAITTAFVATVVLSMATIPLILCARNDAQAGEGRLGDAM